MKYEANKFTFNSAEVIYRDAFDHFFNYLELINHYISIKLIATSDVSNLEYWLKEIACSRFTNKSIFKEFLEGYDYSGVIELMKRFNIKM